MLSTVTAMHDGGYAIGGTLDLSCGHSIKVMGLAWTEMSVGATWPEPCKKCEALATIDPVTDLIEMLQAGTEQEGCRVFDHTPEEFGLHVMENAEAILAALQPAPPVLPGAPYDAHKLPFDEYHDRLKWIQNSPDLKRGNLGRHIADIANDLIRSAYPGLRVPEVSDRKG